MSTFHPVASSLANLNDTRSTISTTRSSTSAVLIKTRTNVCYGITAHTLWRLHGKHEVHTESFQVLFTCQVRCHVHVLLKRRPAVLGRGQLVCLSLLSAYYLAVSICAYQPVYTVWYAMFIKLALLLCSVYILLAGH